MEKDDYSVVMYKVLAYLYQCLKDGVNPNATHAQEITGINEVYWQAVIADMLDNGYIRCDVKFYPPGEYKGLTITAKGVEYLDENPRMAKAKAFLGKAFEVALKAAIEATAAI